MAFESIDVSSLKNSLNSCKNQLNNSISTGLVSSIIDDNIWVCNSRYNLKKALLNLNDIYSQLENEINQFIGVADAIQEYKNMQSKVEELKIEYSNLSGKLYYEESYQDWYYYYDDDGQRQSDYNWATRTVKDNAVELQMAFVKNEINQLEAEMEIKKNSINSSI